MRKLALFVLGFSAAILLSQYWQYGSAELVILCPAIALVAAMSFFKNRRARMLRLAAIGIACGAIWNLTYNYFFFSHAAALSNYSGSIFASVTNYPDETDYGYKAEIKIHFDSRPDVNAILYMDDIPDVGLEPGALISFEGRLMLTSEKIENDYFASKGIPLFAYADSEIDVSGKVKHAELRYFHRRATREIESKISEIFPGFSRPFMLALITGNRTLLDGDNGLFAALSNVGAAHVVAVSGMHVAFLVNLLRRLFGRGRLGNLLCIPFVLFFMAMTGFTASVVRAGIMQIIMLIGSALRKNYDDLTSLSFALLLLLLVNPVSIKNGGLQLSFAATLGIILYSDRVYQIVNAPFAEGRRLHKLYSRLVPRKILNFFCSAVSSTFGALALTVPISAVMFGYVSVIAPLANVLMLWAVTFAFSFGVVCICLSFIFAPLAAAAAWIPAAMVLYIDRTARLLAKVPFAAVYTSSIYIRVWLVFMYGELILLNMLDCRGKLAAFIISNSLVFAGSVYFTCSEAGSGSMTISVLDVGQGQSVMIEADGFTAIIDCGGSLNTNAGDIAANRLNAMGRTGLDALVLTHFHDDHANGAIELMRRVRVNKLIVPEVEQGTGEDIIEYAKERNIEIISVASSEYDYKLGPADMKIIPPLGAMDDNERGLAIICTLGSFDALITGDMNGETELRLIEYTEIPDVELLIAGHHGSKYSTTNELLAAAKPEISVISVGRNLHGHPTPETLSRLEGCGAAVYRTDTNGTVTIKLGEQENTDG